MHNTFGIATITFLCKNEMSLGSSREKIMHPHDFQGSMSN